MKTERPPSHAESNHADSALKAHLAAHIPPGASGFHLLPEGHAALAARLALAQRASRTLDLQYYLFHNDTTGKMVAAALLAAAERGVRMRVLIDDIDTADKELRLATLNAHPNIQVRLFNPFHTRSTNLPVKGWQALRENVRLNRRMHNKVFIADFDLDVIAAGARRRQTVAVVRSIPEQQARNPPLHCQSRPATTVCSAPPNSCSSSAPSSSTATMAAR
jgi:putative cardiolipin synthase